MTAYRKQDDHSIRQMFASIAKNYDLTNTLLSFGLHSRWNQSLVNQFASSEEEKTVVDFCAGTGEIAFRYLKGAKGKKNVYLVDFCQEMLACAKKKESFLKFKNHDIHYIEADVQNVPLPPSFADEITMAYGIRNVKDPEKCVGEIFRLLRPGGRVGILELTRPSASFLRWGHRLYLKSCLPIFGYFLTSNQQAYDYLQKSIDEFISPDKLLAYLRNVGLKKVYAKPLFGGIATLFLANKE